MLFLALSGWLGYYFYKKSHADPIVYKTEKPFITNIVKKTVATGSIVPRREVQIKSQVSGIIEELYVEAGQVVKAGQLIAKIRIVPNVVNVNNAQTSSANCPHQLRRSPDENWPARKQLFEQKVIAEQEYNRFKVDARLKKEALESAENNLQIAMRGASRRTGNGF